MKEIIPNDPEYTDVEQLSQWQKDRDSLKSYRNALYQTMRQNGMGEETALFFTDHFVQAANKHLEDDPLYGREYMRRTMQIITKSNDKPRGPTNSGPLNRVG